MDGIALVCADMCLQVGCVLPKVTQPVRISPGKIPERACATWLTKGGQFFTLIKAGSATLAYCHANRMLYFANPDFALGKECPDHHAFLGQTVEDREDGKLIPRLLVMDMVHPAPPCPIERGALLRTFAHVMPPSCHIQWSGDARCMREFLKGGMPHETEEGIVALTAPLRLVREVTVAIPLIASLSQAVVELNPDPQRKKARRQ